MKKIFFSPFLTFLGNERLFENLRACIKNYAPEDFKDEGPQGPSFEIRGRVILIHARKFSNNRFIQILRACNTILRADIKNYAPAKF